MRILSIFFGVIAGLCAVAAEASQSPEKDSESRTVIAMTHRQVLDFAKDLMSQNKLDDARTVLLAKPYADRELEIERLYLLAQIAAAQKKYDEAIDIYYFILDYQPDIANIRVRLAELLLLKEEWLRSDYHFRLALADKNLPPSVSQKVQNALKYIRYNKNWNLWLNFGVAPDSNVNNTTSGEQCVMTTFGPVCNTLDKPQRDVGLNASIGGNYEHKLSEDWRLRHEGMIYTARYKDKQYDDVYLSYVLGGRYIYRNGDIVIGPAVTRRYLGHKPYNYSLGLKAETNYDVSKQLSLNLNLQYMPTFYDDYGKILDGDVKGVHTRAFYAIDSSKYLVGKVGYEYEKTKDSVYTNYRMNFALGFGAELPYGFHVYVEPALQYTQYKDARWTVRDYQFVRIKERDVTQRYSVSLSNRNIEFMGFMPILTYTYTDKDSNIWQRGYHKSLIELSVQKRF